MPPFFIAVHAGAGYHSPSHEKHYKAAMRKACKAAADVLEIGGCPLSAVAAAIAVLEDDPWTNAGKGSNLTIDGKVECDASIMSGDGCFGAVAAAPGIKNPISVASKLALESQEPLSHGRVRPMMLAGDAARLWALSKGIPAAGTPQEAATMHIVERTRKQYDKYIGMVRESEISNDSEVPASQNGSRQRKRRKESTESNTREKEEDDSIRPDLNDTVGCVVVDSSGKVAAGVSSGGIVLKTPGRVGEAAVFGAGCFAQNGARAVATSVTGVGERVMQHMVAREAALSVRNIDSNDSNSASAVALQCGNYLSETVLQGPSPKECGILCLSAIKGDNNLSVELGAVHIAAQSMAVAYYVSNGDGKNIEETTMLRRGDESLLVQSLTFGTSWTIPN